MSLHSRVAILCVDGASSENHVELMMVAAASQIGSELDIDYREVRKGRYGLLYHVTAQDGVDRSTLGLYVSE